MLWVTRSRGDIGRTTRTSDRRISVNGENRHLNGPARIASAVGLDSRRMKQAPLLT